MVQETLANPVPLCCEPQFSTKGTADRRGQRGPIGVLCRPWHELIHELTAVSTWLADCLLDCPGARLQASFSGPCGTRCKQDEQYRTRERSLSALGHDGARGGAAAPKKGSLTRQVQGES